MRAVREHLYPYAPFADHHYEKETEPFFDRRGIWAAREPLASRCAPRTSEVD